ncbi:MAG: hypothetical protein BWY78_01267 [Alphaproteobacteria bacterium ADurb.Bin438]|nr:MAG: hypothetical protein BWY78_01267 [Alphaproteobacteria bacterium ADurb.Bin438]
MIYSDNFKAILMSLYKDPLPTFTLKTKFSIPAEIFRLNIEAVEKAGELLAEIIHRIA